MSQRMLNVKLLGPTSLGRPVERGLRKRGGAAPQTYYYNYVCMPLFRRLQKCVPPDHSKMHGQLRDCLSACFLSRPFTHANYKTRQKQEQAHRKPTATTADRKPTSPKTTRTRKRQDEEHAHNTKATPPEPQQGARQHNRQGHTQQPLCS